MSTARSYTAITVGPIFDTLSLAASPAALWSASYLFSYLTKRLCVRLVKAGLPEENIISPYYTEKESEDPEGYKLLNQNNGVGLFHDRIFFSLENAPEIDLKKVKESALEDVALAFAFDDKAKTFLKDYVLIADLTFDSDKPIIDGGVALDSLELNKPFVHRYSSNPLLSVFTGSEAHQNELIKHLPITKGLDSWQLKKNRGSLKCLADITAQPKDKLMKKHRYYAIVRSDGDNMGSVISALESDTETRDFSRKCLSYCSDIANAVYSEFGGVTIYSGGDDLLAILPCEAKNGNTVFDYIKRANEIFSKHFPQSGVSLSFGISICHYKYPLYEALDESAALLFGCAKGDKGKNCATIRLHKHSGQSSGVVIRNGESLDAFLALQDNVLGKGDDEKEQVLLSALHKLALFEKSFDAAGDNEQQIANLFCNTFDAPAHEIKFVKETLPGFYTAIANGCHFIESLEEKKHSHSIESSEEKEQSSQKEQPTAVNAMCAVLRILKFLTESAGD